MTKKAELHKLIEKLPDPESVGDEKMYSAVQELLKLVFTIESADAAVSRSAATYELTQHRLALVKEMTRLFAEVIERLTEESAENESEPSWSRLSADAFARDWASDADRVYDRLQ